MTMKASRITLIAFTVAFLIACVFAFIAGCTADFQVTGSSADSTGINDSSKLPAGATCTLDEQCRSGMCEGNDNGREGVCR